MKMEVAVLPKWWYLPTKLHGITFIELLSSTSKF